MIVAKVLVYGEERAGYSQNALYVRLGGVEVQSRGIHCEHVNRNLGTSTVRICLTKLIK